MTLRTKIFLLLILAIISALPSMALTGKWRGELTVGTNKLPLVFGFTEQPDGTTTATMDSPQQNVRDLPLEVMFLSADSLSVACKMIGAEYNAKNEPDRIVGTFSQRGYKLPLILTPELSLIERRPQTPQPPFPYIEKDTVFYSADSTRLAGTLTMLPQISAKCPVVVMVTGSGPQNRDEEIFEHRPFAVIADYLARNGVASFRYDDRGVASSEGGFATATLDTFKEDAEAALKFVKESDAFGKAGILGHSEGGTIALSIAADGDPDFIITLAGAAVPLKEILLDQNRRSLDANGIAGVQKESSLRLLELLFDTITKQHKSGQTAPIDIERLCRDNNLEVTPVVMESVKRSNSTRNAYFDSLVSSDPTDDMKKIKCRVLAINGTKDTQVNADSNLEAIARNVRNVEIKRMEGLNHLMQHAHTGEVDEYGAIRETISPEVLQIIGNFILNQ
ncbi:MAG: alpha/beta hydrolase [Muribaculaceae bacterium]|nr:alpha/beta hydrolase [Muribaculaceae bacterium]